MKELMKYGWKDFNKMTDNQKKLKTMFFGLYAFEGTIKPVEKTNYKPYFHNLLFQEEHGELEQMSKYNMSAVPLKVVPHTDRKV